MPNNIDQNDNVENKNEPRESKVNSVSRTISDAEYAAYNVQYWSGKLKQTAEVLGNAAEQSGKALAYGAYTIIDKTARIRRPINSLFFQEHLDAESQDLMRNHQVKEINEVQLREIEKRYHDIKKSKWLKYHSNETKKILRDARNIPQEDKDKDKKRAERIFNHIFSEKGEGTDFRRAVIEYFEPKSPEMDIKPDENKGPAMR